MIQKKTMYTINLTRRQLTQEINKRDVLLEVGVIKNKRVAGPGSLKSRTLLMASSL